MKPVVTTLVMLAVVTSVNLEKISPTAAVCLIGGVMATDGDEVAVKYKRKKSP